MKIEVTHSPEAADLKSGTVEDAARAQGAVVSYLKTVEAKFFYESLGYGVFGKLEDRPIGTTLYHVIEALRSIKLI